MTPGWKHIAKRLAVSLFTLVAEAHGTEPPNPGVETMLKICREIWAGVAGVCGTAIGYVKDFDLMFWLGALVLLLTAADRCYEILLKCRRFRQMGAED